MYILRSDMNLSIAKHHKLEFTYFPNAFFVILYTSLTLKFVSNFLFHIQVSFHADGNFSAVVADPQSSECANKVHRALPDLGRN
jgi:hypothetical protein